MRLDVPFVRNLKKWKGNGWCGPLSLACILRYYGFRDSVEDIVEQAGTIGIAGTSPQGLINVCLKKGLGVRYFAKNEIENSRDYSDRLKEFLKKVDAERLDAFFLQKNKKFEGYSFSNKQLSVRDIEEYLGKGNPVLLLHNVSFVFGDDKKMWPHYIAVVGYDKDNFIIHNHAKGNHRLQKVNKKLIEKSWDYDGFGRTLIVPYRK